MTVGPTGEDDTRLMEHDSCGGGGVLGPSVGAFLHVHCLTSSLAWPLVALPTPQLDNEHRYQHVISENDLSLAYSGS